jgi:hypothetical protein
VDWFVFNSVEDGKKVIRDFTTRGTDRDVIVLADTMFSNFTGDDGADLVAGGFLRAHISHGKTEVQVDVDGGGNSWQTIAELSQRLSSSELASQVIVHPDWVI